MKEKEQMRIDPITYRGERMVVIEPLRDWLRFWSRYGVFHQGMADGSGAPFPFPWEFIHLHKIAGRADSNAITVRQ